MSIKFSLLTHHEVIGKCLNIIDGQLDKTTNGNIKQAGLEIKHIKHIRELVDILKGITKFQHLCAGAPRKLKINRCVHGKKDDFSVNRTNKDLPFPPGQAVMTIDSDDITEWPDLLNLAAFAHVRTTSSSSLIFQTSTGETLIGFKGSHIFFAVKNGKDIPRALEIFHKYQVLNYLAVHKISAVGGFLERSCADQALRSPSQPIYVTPALGHDLEQHKIIEYVDGIPVIDTLKVLPDLTEAQEEAYQQAVAYGREALQPEMLAVQQSYIKQRAAADGISESTLKHALSSPVNQLEEDFVIVTTKYGKRTVKEICADPAKYHEQNCSDPFEPGYGNTKTVAKMFIDQTQPRIESKAHGGTAYILIDDLNMYGNFDGKIPEPQIQSDVPQMPPIASLIQSLANNQGLTDEIIPAPPPPERDFAFFITEPLPKDIWPEQFCNSMGKPKGIIQNFIKMLSMYGVKIQYNVTTKDVVITGNTPGTFSTKGDIKDNANYAVLYSLCVMNNFPVTSLDLMMVIMMNEHQLNPVKDYILSKPWDEKDRVLELFHTITLSADQDPGIAYMMFVKWLRGAVMIAQRQIKSFEHVLIFQARKGGEGKTRWFEKLCPEEWNTTGLMLDPKDKDSVKEAVSYWVVELGEVDSTFKRSDLKTLMAFLSKQKDSIRLPYGKASNTYERRTAFFGTVNKDDFLRDDSGDRRFWPISIESLNYDHDNDMQQLWAQVDTMTEINPWLNPIEQQQVIHANKRFKKITSIEEAIQQFFEGVPMTDDMVFMSGRNALESMGIINPNDNQIGIFYNVADSLGYKKHKKNNRRGVTIPNYGIVQNN